MKKTSNIDYWQNSDEYDARRVRALVLDWLKAGGDRGHSSEMAYLSSEAVIRRAVAVCGYEWDIGGGVV